MEFGKYLCVLLTRPICMRKKELVEFLLCTISRLHTLNRTKNPAQHFPPECPLRFDQTEKSHFGVPVPITDSFLACLCNASNYCHFFSLLTWTGKFKQPSPITKHGARLPRPCPCTISPDKFIRALAYFILSLKLAQSFPHTKLLATRHEDALSSVFAQT